MRAIRTNLLRIDFSTQHYLYQLEVISHSYAVKQIITDIEVQLSSKFPYALISYPLLYSRQSLSKNVIYTHLTDGSTVQFRLTQCPANQSQDIVSIIANLISRKLLFLTELLYSPIFDAFFNPFDELVQNGQRMITGWRLGVEMSQAGAMLSIQGLRLTLSEPGSLGQQSEVLLDYDCGKFFLKQSIVRIDKDKGQVILRNNTISRRQALYSANITPINGYPLALNIHNLIERIKQTSQQFCSKWDLKFDTRLIEVQGTYPNAGVLGFRQNLDKGTAELISPMNFHNFLNNYVNYFNSVKFDDLLRASVVYLVDSQNEERIQFVANFRKQIEKVGTRMELQLVGKTVTYTNYSHLQQLLNLMANQPSELIRIFIVFHNKQKDKTQLQPFQKLIQYMINSLIPFHLVEVDLNKQHSLDALAYHHLSTIYTKSRVNPWKLKSIPFMNQPMMVIALYIQQTRQKVYSVSLVATMNLFFTKFTAVHKITGKDTVAQAVEKGVIECIQTFKSKHQRYPNRVFLFRTGSDAQEFLDLQRGKSEVRLRGGELTYVSLYNQHGIRIFNQLDNNYISGDTVKKVQLFLHTNINKQLYFQIELENPPYRVKISPTLQNDPSFVPKVLDLISRIVLGGVGHQYGKGLGILDYPKKLNSFKQYNLASWLPALTEGILYFL